MARLASAALAIALAACSKTTPSSPPPGSAGSPGSGSGSGSAPAAPAPPAPPPGAAKPVVMKGPRMSPADEAALYKHYEQKGWGKPVEVESFEQVPGLHHAVFSDGMDYVVIRDGKVVEGQGLAAVGGYMKDVKLLTLHPTARDLTTLLELFGALPPISSGGYATPDQFYNHERSPAASPKLELAPAGGKLVLHYLVPGRVGATANPNVKTMMRWTLSIPPDYKLAWREEETKVDLGPP